MKTQLIQNVFKMMIGVSALIASTAFFINTISPVQASENKLPNFEGITSEVVADKYIYVGCGSGIYRGLAEEDGGVRTGWQKVVN
jgi:hypothetical protein